MYIGLHVKYPLFLSDFNETEFSGHVFEKYSTSNYINIPPAGSVLFHVDRWTDMAELTVALRNFAKVLKIIYMF